MTPIAAQIDKQVPPFLLPSPEKRPGNPLVAIENGQVGYDGGRPVLSRLNLRIDMTDRIGILGQNGNGKSTLAKLIAGTIPIQSGTNHQSKKLEIGYFTQHQIEDLDAGKTPYEYISDRMEDATEAQKRARLGQLGFGIDKADTRVVHLSGGEKSRLLFSLVSLSGPHILILDEPTNHLDIDSRQALIHAINNYEGAVIVISHDRHLMEATVDRLWLVSEGTVTPYGGDLEQYRNQCLSNRRISRKEKLKSNVGNGARYANRTQQRRRSAELRSKLAPLKRESEHWEKQIEFLNRKITDLDAELGKPEIYEETPAKAQDFAKQRGRLAQKLATAEESWLETSQKYEKALASVEPEMTERPKRV
jgi:ATP-binding cassette subfamily F protein 3